METANGVQRHRVPRHQYQKRVWRGSLLLHFGEEVGETLDELGQEYDNMITDFEKQKSRLKAFAPQEEVIREEVRAESPTLSEADSADSQSTSKRTGSISTGGGGIKNSLRNAQNSIKRRFSNRASSSSSSQQKASPILPRRASKDDADSLNSEVFGGKEDRIMPSSANDVDLPMPMAYDQPLKAEPTCASGKLTVGADGKPPISPQGKKGHRVRSATVNTRDDHMVAPPVVVDGEVKHEYQYVSPSRHVRNANENQKAGIFRSSSFAKILGMSENGTARKSGRKDESPLKALYKATVLNETNNNKENQNNNNSNIISSLRAT